jgi:hypothetical protein
MTPQAATTLVPQQAQSTALAATPASMLDRAIASGASIETLEKLIALKERWDAGEARKAFDSALAAAKAEIPVIGKNRAVDFTTGKGRTNYRFEDLAGIAAVVNPILARHGMTYRFRTSSVPTEPVTVTCILSHRDGHSEENTLSAGRDDSGNKNSIQAIGSTVTYLQRYTLKAALGLAASNDDDGRGAGGDVSGGDTSAPINATQLAALQTAIVQAGADIGTFCVRFGIDRVEDLPAAKFHDAKARLAQYAKRKQEQENAK